MKRAVSFTKRNMIEMYRDPIIYIFCLLFPLAMLVLFVVINSFTNGNTPVFELKSLIPGLMMFSFTFVMLALTLLVSKDKTTTFLKRLYTSPMKARDFLIGYYIPGFVIGILQGIWIPFFVTTAVYTICAVFLANYWYKRIEYICPECHTRFQPRKMETLLANHNPKMRKLTCPSCRRKIWSLEVYRKEVDA